jgi:CheY-like chemotaxis protein
MRTRAAAGERRRKPDERRAARAFMPGLRLMIVEDEAIGAMYLRHTVEGMGHRVLSIVDSGEDAIKAALDQRPDLVLMDIRIRGDIDGVMAAYSIKAATEIPSILVSAYGKNELRQYRNVEEDFLFLGKPVLEEELRRAIDTVLERLDRQDSSCAPR